MTEREYLGYDETTAQLMAEARAEDEIAEAERIAHEGDEQAQVDAQIADEVDRYDPAEPWMDAYLDDWARGEGG